MPLRIVQSKQNPRLKQLRRALAQPPREAGNGLVGIEGPNLLEEALRSGLRIECVFVAEGRQHLLESMNLSGDVEVLVLPKDLLDAATTTDNPQPIAALVETPGWTWDHILQKASESPALILVLAGIQDPGNLGTILRSAEAFGASGVLSLPGTVSAWNPKAVRASAGSVFRLPILSMNEEELHLRLSEGGIKLWTTAVHEAEPVDAVNLAESVAFLIGNEGNGVPFDLAGRADGALTIPCPGPVESLNAAVAASVLLYEVSRQRSVRRLVNTGNSTRKEASASRNPYASPENLR